MVGSGNRNRSKPSESAQTLRSREQGVWVNPKLSGERLDRIEGQVALPALDRCQVARRDLKLLGKALLGEGAALALGTHVDTERLP